MLIDSLPDQEVQINGVDFSVMYTDSGIPFYKPNQNLSQLSIYEQSLFDLPADHQIPPHNSSKWFSLDGTNGRGYFYKIQYQESTNSLFYRSMFLDLNLDSGVQVQSALSTNLSMLGDTLGCYIPHFVWNVGFVDKDNFVIAPIIKLSGDDISPFIQDPFLRIDIPIDPNNNCFTSVFGSSGAIEELHLNRYNDLAFDDLESSQSIDLNTIHRKVDSYLLQLGANDPERDFMNRLYWGNINIIETYKRLRNLMIQGEDQSLINACGKKQDPKDKIFELLNSVFVFKPKDSHEIKHRRPLISSIFNKKQRKISLR